MTSRQTFCIHKVWLADLVIISISQNVQARSVDFLFHLNFKDVPHSHAHSDSSTLPRPHRSHHRAPPHTLTHRSNNVGHMRHGGARGSPKVEHLGRWFDVDLVDAPKDGCRKLASKRVPHTVLHLHLSFRLLRGRRTYTWSGHLVRSSVDERMQHSGTRPKPVGRADQNTVKHAQILQKECLTR